MNTLKPHVQTTALRPVEAFDDRADAGRALAAFVRPSPDHRALVLGIPRGGLPVGRPLAEALGCEMRPILVRKLPIPAEPEMGFGAVTIDGTVTLNDAVVSAFRLDPRVVHLVTDEVRRELERRRDAYPGSWPLPELAGRHVWLVDDGLASGYSAMAAVEMIRAHGPSAISLAVPCAPIETLERLTQHVDDLWCLFAQESRPFAVASFYRRFPDLTDDQVLTALGM